MKGKVEQHGKKFFWIITYALDLMKERVIFGVKHKQLTRTSRHSVGEAHN